MTQAKTNILSSATPEMRAVVLAIRRDYGTGSKTRCREIVRDMPAEAKAGFVIKRHLDDAIDLAFRMDTRRADKKGRNMGWNSRPFYGRSGP